jgi:ribosomal protein L11 methyltransferase
VKDSYICVSVNAPDFMEEAISQLFWQYECQGVMIEDPGIITNHLQKGDWEASVFDEREIITGRINLTAWFTDDETGCHNIIEFREALASLLSVCDRDENAVTIDQYMAPDVDWQAEFKKNFQSRVIGKNIVIKPTWEEYEPQEKQIIIEMDPGMAFGSGDHITTVLCLEALEKYFRPGVKVADIGCGSAILAIAAALLGAKEVLAVDNDITAIKVAKENIAINNVDHLVELACGNLADQLDDTYDIILANIVADPIIALIPQAAHLLAPDGILIASGILASRSAEIKNILGQHNFIIKEEWYKDIWYAMAAVHV